MTTPHGTPPPSKGVDIDTCYHCGEKGANYVHMFNGAERSIHKHCTGKKPASPPPDQLREALRKILRSSWLKPETKVLNEIMALLPVPAAPNHVPDVGKVIEPEKILEPSPKTEREAKKPRQCKSCGHPEDNHPYRHMFVPLEFGRPEGTPSVTPESPAPAPTDADLLPFGWAPGDYTSLCVLCGKYSHWNAKRVALCRLCAVSKWEKSLEVVEAIPQPEVGEVQKFSICPEAYSSLERYYQAKVQALEASLDALHGAKFSDRVYVAMRSKMASLEAENARLMEVEKDLRETLERGCYRCGYVGPCPESPTKDGGSK